MVVAIVLACLLSIGIIVLVIFLQFKHHNNFMKSAMSIKKGMTLTNVSIIMQRHWKGIFYGGTVTRIVKVVFENKLVVNVTTTNFAVSIFF